MVTDRQIRKLFGLLRQGKSLSVAALSAGVSEKTARRYRALGKLPSESKREHDWRTRKDPFELVWSKVEEQLEVNPGLQAKTVLEWLQREHPGKFQDGQLRTLQRRIKQWRATDGPGKEVFFRQTHHPGDLCASDFTHMTSLGVTIAGQQLEHLVYHFVLTYSNWETVSLCYSESFESLSDGVQHALWQLGGVPVRHRTDRLSAAVNNPSDAREFTARYQGLMNHYGLSMEKTQPRHANENGDVESSHRHFKTAVDQALMMRGSRDFCDVADYVAFLEIIVEQRNAGREQRLAEEREVLRELPTDRLDSFRQVRVRVSSGSLIQVLGNTYSVHSRLIGERVHVRIHAEHLEVWYAQKRVDRFARLRGRGKHYINYRHIIDWLVRKPGAFENYRYREDLFPTSYFRMAYDTLCDRHTKNVATREYLEILRLAAYENETAVNEILRRLMTRGDDDTDSPADIAWTSETIDAELQKHGSQTETASLTDVQVDSVDLTAFDHLLDDARQLDVQHDVTFSDRESDSDPLLHHQLQDREVFDGYQELESGELENDSSEIAGEPNIGSERNTSDSSSRTSPSSVS